MGIRSPAHNESGTTGKASDMQIAINWDLCIGSGLCVANIPQAFALVRYGEEVRAVLVAPPLDDGALVVAAQACPTLAIRLTENGRAVYPPPPANPDPSAHR